VKSSQKDENLDTRHDPFRERKNLGPYYVNPYITSSWVFDFELKKNIFLFSPDPP
jgi:hypothetical protein